jgi:tetratricopeptide (TPR) repeat protein|mmetsp:Transcript_37680/g.59592  ORF Transcript_37680/g.59592 Transcript_37680/m.59592 type:complete len:513 (+) Transcript_37680:69-1607(+)
MAPLQAPPQRLDEIKLEDIDYEVVKECKDKEVLKQYLKLLADDGNYFVDLVNAVKDRLFDVAPKDYYLLYPRQVSQTEADDITKDLLEWQDSVKQTDEALLKSRKNKIWDDVGAGVTAPIRGQEPVVSRPNTYRKEEIKDEKKKSAQGGRYARDKTKMKDYYAAWDQIDVDALEAEFDEEEHKAEEARRKHFEDMKEEQDNVHNAFTDFDSDVNDNVPDAHRRHLADSEKEKGNEAFYSKDYEEAEAYYSRSLQYRADDPSVWANRALARLKLQRFAPALEDCEHALAVNPRYMKALHRKGKALYELQRYEEAVQSFQLALMESPGNTQINGDLMVARRKLRSDGPGVPQPKTFAPPQRSRRPDESTCIIEEIEDEDEHDGKTRKMPEPGYTRVQIEEDSDSEEDEESPCNRIDSTGFHKVQIQECSDDSEEDREPEREPASAQACTSTPSKHFQKVQIVDESDSDEDVVQRPISKASPPEGKKDEETLRPCIDVVTSAPEAAHDLDFDGMD